MYNVNIIIESMRILQLISNIIVQNFVNVPFDYGELQHGHRYLFCIHTHATSIQYELWTQQLKEVAACSDGVTVDITPPEPGDVWLGQDKSHAYQVRRQGYQNNNHIYMGTI